MSLTLCLSIYQSLLFIQVSDIWSKPNSENFTQCIDLPRNHKSMKFCYEVYSFLLLHYGLFQDFSPLIFCIFLTDLDEKTNGYILVNANGGLNQMRFGVWQC